MLKFSCKITIFCLDYKTLCSFINGKIIYISIFFRNYVRIRRISLNKGSFRNWGKSGLRIGDRTQFHVLLWIAFKEHPMLSHQPFYDSPSGAKVIIPSELAKTIHIFLFWACSTPLNWLRHFVWHLLEKCVLGYVLLPNICAVSHTLGTLTWVFSTPLVQEVYLGGNSSVVNGRISICPLSPTGMMLFCKLSADNGRFSNMLHHAS